MPGLTPLQDSEDVVPMSTLWNLEVWSTGWCPVCDDNPNYRRDGTRTRIVQVQAAQGHTGVHGRDTPAVTWATEWIEHIYGWR